MSTTETPAKVQKKRGPDPDPARTAIRQLFSDWSDRTFATYWRGHSILTELKAAGLIDEETQLATIAAATRPNGSMNVCKFADEAQRLVARLVFAGKIGGAA